jgi:hypothetical protein
METVNLKAAITFRVVFHDDWKGEDRVSAFTTKTFRGERLQTRTVPDPQERVPYTVHEIAIDSNNPWLTLKAQPRIEIIWSNVLGVQHEEVA